MILLSATTGRREVNNKLFTVGILHSYGLGSTEIVYAYLVPTAINQIWRWCHYSPVIL